MNEPEFGFDGSKMSLFECGSGPIRYLKIWSESDLIFGSK